MALHMSVFNMTKHNGMNSTKKICITVCNLCVSSAHTQHTLLFHKMPYIGSLYSDDIGCRNQRNMHIRLAQTQSCSPKLISSSYHAFSTFY